MNQPRGGGNTPISREELEAAVLRHAETIEDQQNIIRNERQEKADLRRQIDGQASEIQAHVVRGNELVRDVGGLREENLELRRQAEEKDAQIERLTGELNALRYPEPGSESHHIELLMRLQQIDKKLDEVVSPIEGMHLGEVLLALRKDVQQIGTEPRARQVRANVSSSYSEAGEIPPFLRRQGLR